METAKLRAVLDLDEARTHGAPPEEYPAAILFLFCVLFILSSLNSIAVARWSGWRSVCVSWSR
jgi:hypothetical protein